jgi:hypothetical protein
MYFIVDGRVVLTERTAGAKPHRGSTDAAR